MRTKLTEADVLKAFREGLAAAKASGKARKCCHENGMYLSVSPSGTGTWNLKYQFGGRANEVSLKVTYPGTDSLKRARKVRDEERRRVEDGIDPSAFRKAAKAAQADSVEALAREWLAAQKDLEPDTIRAHTQRLEDYVFPFLGKRAIKTVEPPELLMALRRIEAKARYDTAARTLRLCGRIWRFAIATGRASRDVTRDLEGSLASVQSKSFAAIIDPKGVGELLRALDSYVGQPAVCAALKLAPLLFVRPGELRAAEWVEFDLDGENPEWRIPAARMKMRDAHIVPLARQAVELLRELQLVSTGRFLFPSLRTPARSMSENTVNAALRRLGYSGEMQTGHGFRTIASTLLNELNWNGDLIELQLAHRPRSVRAIYNKAQKLPERRQMMQAWADHLDTLRAGGSSKVVPIKRAVAAT